MAKAIRWTDEKVKALSLPEGKAESRTCVETGLYLFVRRKRDGSLSKTWQYRAQVNGSRRWLSLGPYPAVRLAVAREELRRHQEIQAQARKGEADHPVLAARTARRAAAGEPSVEEAFHEWLDDKRLGSPRIGGAPVRERTLKLLQDAFNGDIKAKAGEVKISKISPDLIQSCIDAPRRRGAPSQAAYVYKTWRGLVNFAKKRRYVVGQDPMDGIDNPKPYRPAPVVAASDKDLKIFFRVLAEAKLSPSTRIAYELQLLTGVRPDEAVSALLDEFDLKKRIWHIPAERVKTREAISIYLSDQALALVEEAMALPRSEENPYLLPGRGDGKQGPAVASRSLKRLSERLTEAGAM